MVADMCQNTFRKSFWLLLFGLVVSACAGGSGQAITANAFPPGLFDPTEEIDVELPEGYFLSWGRDRIAPVYEPTYVGRDGVDWPDDEVVIGINIDGQQRAFPVGFMSNRELVIDQIDDIPLLVTW